jgi:hypothetical protein
LPLRGFLSLEPLSSVVARPIDIALDLIVMIFLSAPPVRIELTASLLGEDRSTNELRRHVRCEVSERLRISAHLPDMPQLLFRCSRRTGMVPLTGFEPATSSFGGKRSSSETTRAYRAADGIRTHMRPVTFHLVRSQGGYHRVAHLGQCSSSYPRRESNSHL